MATWTGITQGDTIVGVNIGSYPDQSVHVDGGFGGSTITIEGSMQTTTGGPGSWIVLTDAFNTTLSFTTTSIKNVLQNCYWVRPQISGGAGASVNVYLIGNG